MKHWIVEHESRGCYVGCLWNSTAGTYKYKCRYSILRSNKQVVKFYRLKDAKAIADKIKGSYVLEISKLVTKKV